MGRTRFATIAIACLSLFSAQADAQFVSERTGEWWVGYPALDSIQAQEFVGRDLAQGDFNCDDRADLVVGRPYKNGVFPVEYVGAVTVIYGSASGLDPATVQILDQGPGYAGAAEGFDWFGTALATGDFDRDGCDDLAVGVPGEGLGAIGDAGAVQLFYGGLGGLGSDELWTQDSSGVLGQAEEGDWFGGALAVGDFDGDTYDDLAIGAPNEDLGAVVDAGAIHVLFGSAAGLSATDNVLLYRGLGPIGGVPTADELLGRPLAAGRGQNDSQSILFIGVPEAAVGVESRAGRVIVLSDVTAASPGINEVFQGLGGIPGTAEAGDRFGDALAAGDFDGNGNVDIAIGVPDEDVGSIDAGAVNVLFLGGGAPAPQLWTTATLPGPALNTFEDDTLGYSLLAGDFDSDGIDDLAIANTGPTDAGRVHILYDFGLGPASRQTLVDPFPSTNNAFGYGMAAGDLFPGVGLDLVIGEPGEDLGAPTVVDAGVLQYFSNVLVFPDGFESGDTSAWSATVP